MPSEDIDDQFDEIINAALRKASQLDIPLESYVAGLEGWIAEILVNIDATGLRRE